MGAHSERWQATAQALQERVVKSEAVIQTLTNRELERGQILTQLVERANTAGGNTGAPTEPRGNLTELKAVLDLEKYSGDRGQFGKFRDDLEEAICGTHQGWRGVLDYLGKAKEPVKEEAYRE